MRARRLAAVVLVTAVSLPLGGRMAAAQQLVTREQAIQAALRHGTRSAIAGAGEAAARAQLSIARAFPNPALSAGYSESTPQLHAAFDLPLEYPWARGARIRAAQEAAVSAAYQSDFERAAVRFDADTSYTRALATAARVRLSRRNAQDADSLLQMATLRRDAGDASELDVQLAIVSAGQLANAAADDSASAVSAVLDLQTLMGLSGGLPIVDLADTLALSDSASGGPAAGTPLAVAAAEAAVRAEEQRVSLQRRSRFEPPTLQAGFETQDPTGSEPGLLPTVGITLPLPLFNWNRGGIDLAAANLARARAELELARLASEAAEARAYRERAVAFHKALRDRELLGAAERVASMSALAYAEGESALAAVLEAQRTAREARARYVDDLAALNNAEAALQLANSSAEP